MKKMDKKEIDDIAELAKSDAKELFRSNHVEILSRSTEALYEHSRLNNFFLIYLSSIVRNNTRFIDAFLYILEKYKPQLFTEIIAFVEKSFDEDVEDRLKNFSEEDAKYLRKKIEEIKQRNQRAKR